MLKVVAGVKSAPKNAHVKLRISLMGSSPQVWRRMIVPAQMHLGKLHKVFQVTMGWRTSHLHEFVIAGKRYTDPSYDDFAVDPKDRTLDQAKITLAQIVAYTPTFEYRYDFGDGWRHQIEIEEVTHPDPRMTVPICIGGENACPPEDCGGIGGYGDFLKKLSSPTFTDPDDRDEADVLAWVGGYFDPASFDPNRINIDHLWRKKW
jgi:hypothetical protein